MAMAAMIPTIATATRPTATAPMAMPTVAPEPCDSACTRATSAGGSRRGGTPENSVRTSGFSM